MHEGPLEGFLLPWTGLLDQEYQVKDAWKGTCHLTAGTHAEHPCVNTTALYSQLTTTMGHTSLWNCRGTCHPAQAKTLLGSTDCVCPGYREPTVPTQGLLMSWREQLEATQPLVRHLAGTNAYTQMGAIFHVSHVAFSFSVASTNSRPRAAWHLVPACFHYFCFGNSHRSIYPSCSTPHQVALVGVLSQVQLECCFEASAPSSDGLVHFVLHQEQ